MKFLFVAPRFHTNQIPIVKGLLSKNHDVTFFCQYIGGSEDYSYIKPDIIGYSNLFKFFIFFHNLINNKRLKENQDIYKFGRIYGFPPLIKYYKRLSQVHPDIVIVRERCIYSLVTYLYCRMRKIPCILYNQGPYLITEQTKISNLKRLFKALSTSLNPSVRITPVLGVRTTTSYPDENAVYLPFIINPVKDAKSKAHFMNGKVNIISVGKFQERKNHFLLVDAIKQLTKKYDIRLTIIGECSTNHHNDYFEKLKRYINNNGLGKVVNLKTNLKYEEVYKEYLNSDLFVIPSNNEPASISQLEAMACALPVICSDTNGTKHLIKENVNGFTFKDNSRDDLTNKVRMAIEDKETLIQMGNNSYLITKEEHNFDIYYQKLSILLESRYGLIL